VIEKLHDRYVAGQLLAEKLLDFAKCPETMVLGLPRGGGKAVFGIASPRGQAFPGGSASEFVAVHAPARLM
jgi:predicted phosphoribosyltransferase